VVDHALGVDRLRETALVLPEEEQREHLANIAELVATIERDGQRLPWWRRWLPVFSRG
jgi:hypothetical protein